MATLAQMEKALDELRAMGNTVEGVLQMCAVTQEPHPADGEVVNVLRSREREDPKGKGHWCLGWYEHEPSGNWYAYSTVLARNGWENPSERAAHEWLAEQHLMYMSGRIHDIERAIEERRRILQEEGCYGKTARE